MKKPATQAEKDHMDRVAGLGCLVCLELGYPDSPAEVHHIANGGMRASHWQTIPLCPTHHRHGSFGEAIHNGKRTFEANHGSEKELLAKTNWMLNRRVA